MRRVLSVSIVLAAAACGASTPGPAIVVAPTPPAPATARVAAPDPAAASGLLVRLVDAQRVYIERGDLKPFFELMSPSVEVEAARSRARSKYDARFGKQRLEAIYGWAAANEGSAAFSSSKQHAEAFGESVSVDMNIAVKTGDTTSAFGQHFEMVRGAAGDWKVVRFRYWPILPDTGEEFGDTWFAEIDRKIEEDERRGDDRDAARDLMLAYRFEESAAVSRKLTDATPDEPWVWKMRAQASAMVGDRDDAERASATARKLAAERK